MSTQYVPDEMRRFCTELQHVPELADLILDDPVRFPLVEDWQEREIRCSKENLERAICRAVARCREWGEFWKVEVVE